MTLAGGSDMPFRCFAQAVTLGSGWAAVAGSSGLVRLFTLGGMQREIFRIPGPIVCMAGASDCLVICYHQAAGEQCHGRSSRLRDDEGDSADLHRPLCRKPKLEKLNL